MSAFDSARRIEIVSGKHNGARAAPQIYRSPNLDMTGHRVGSSAAGKPWGFADPEAKRRKRIAKYKVYTVEGRVKDSLRKGLRWFKNKCSRIVHGF